MRTVQQENSRVVSGSISYCVKSVCRSTIIIWTLGLWIISEAHVVVICGKYIQTCTLTRFTMRYWVEQPRWAGLPGQPPQSDYRLLWVSEEQSAALWPSMSSAFCFFFALFTAAKVLTLFKENICIWWPSQKETRLLKDGCTVVNVCAILLYNITWPFEKCKQIEMASESGFGTNDFSHCLLSRGPELTFASQHRSEQSQLTLFWGVCMAMKWNKQCAFQEYNFRNDYIYILLLYLECIIISVLLLSFVDVITVTSFLYNNMIIIKIIYNNCVCVYNYLNIYIVIFIYLYAFISIYIYHIIYTLYNKYWYDTNIWGAKQEKKNYTILNI